ncbi:MAG TPA: hypothetical protein VHZ76_01315, partial [Gammaproteobacteria bacterium]|nr:hypothetical protein [Gammaproteobacteria bacterium]
MADTEVFHPIVDLDLLDQVRPLLGLKHLEERNNRLFQRFGKEEKINDTIKVQVDTGGLAHKAFADLKIIQEQTPTWGFVTLAQNVKRFHTGESHLTGVDHHLANAYRKTALTLADKTDELKPLIAWVPKAEIIAEQQRQEAEAAAAVPVVVDDEGQPIHPSRVKRFFHSVKNFIFRTEFGYNLSRWHTQARHLLRRSEYLSHALFLLTHYTAPFAKFSYDQLKTVGKFLPGFYSFFGLSYFLELVADTSILARAFFGKLPAEYDNSSFTERLKLRWIKTKSTLLRGSRPARMSNALRWTIINGIGVILASLTAPVTGGLSFLALPLFMPTWTAVALLVDIVAEAFFTFLKQRKGNKRALEAVDGRLEQLVKDTDVQRLNERARDNPELLDRTIDLIVAARSSAEEGPVAESYFSTLNTLTATADDFAKLDYQNYRVNLQNDQSLVIQSAADYQHQLTRLLLLSDQVAQCKINLYKRNQRVNDLFFWEKENASIIKTLTIDHLDSLNDKSEAERITENNTKFRLDAANLDTARKNIRLYKEKMAALWQ